MIILWLLLILLFIGIIIVSCYLGITVHKNMPLKVHEMFEYNFNELCIGDFYSGNDIHSFNKHCLKDSFYGNQVCILDWVSNKNKDDYVCLYYLLQTSLKHSDNKVYTNTNYWITIYSKKNKDTAGSARWSNLYLDVNNGQRRSTVPFSHSIMTATSGILSNLQGAEIIIDYRQDVRKIHIFSKGSYKSSDYIKYKNTI